MCRCDGRAYWVLGGLCLMSSSGAIAILHLMSQGSRSKLGAGLLSDRWIQGQFAKSVSEELTKRTV